MIVMFSFTNVIAYILGLATFIIFPRLLGIFLRVFPNNARTSRDNDIYGLEHALLNSKFPPETMWMNMGYWENTTDFPTACRNLMLLMLKKANILENYGSKSIRIWDLGFGCGDQTILLCAELEKAGIALKRYDGITINKSQFNFAQERIFGDTNATTNIRARSKHDIVNLHLADASNPKCWPAWTPASITDSDCDDSSRWILALDSLYHFQPSRYPVLHHASHKLSSSLLAFDLLLSTSITPIQKIFLRFICLLTQIPYSNLLTVEEYTDMLVSAGYQRSNVEIFDITEHVFPGLERFITTRGKVVKIMGAKGGWTGFGVIGRIVGWWGRSKVVRGCIIVARKADIYT